MGNVGLSGLGARKKSRVLRTEPEGKAEIRKQEWKSNQQRKRWGWGSNEGGRKKPRKCNQGRDNHQEYLKLQDKKDES